MAGVFDPCDHGMSRTVERLIDLAAMLMLLIFCFLFRESQPALAGLVVGAAIQFWMSKNAQSPDSAAHRDATAAIDATVARTLAATTAASERALAAATAAAEVLRTAEQAAGSRSVTAHEEAAQAV